MTTASRVTDSIQQEINRKDINTEDKKALNPNLEPDTFMRYCNDFKRVVWYILRVWKRPSRPDGRMASISKGK